MPVRGRSGLSGCEDRPVGGDAARTLLASARSLSNDLGRPLLAFEPASGALGGAPLAVRGTGRYFRRPPILARTSYPDERGGVTVIAFAGAVSDRGRRGPATLVVFLVIIVLALGGARATAQDRSKVVDLPIGFQPEGIAARNANTFFVGSIPTGAIYRGNLKTGERSIFVPAQEGRSAIGLSIRRGMLFVAGGATGQAHVYDARTGAEQGVFQLTTQETFVNDVIATKKAAYFTDSINP